MVGWNADTAAGSLGGAVTLVEGSNFSISDVTGDMFSDRPHGSSLRTRASCPFGE